MVLDLQKLLNLTLLSQTKPDKILALKYFKHQSAIGQLAHLKCKFLS